MNYTLNLSMLSCVFMLAACGPTNKREIKRVQVNTEDARLTGYLEYFQDAQCSPLCSVVERTFVPHKTVVEDEATLVEANGQACADVVVRTVVDYDYPFEAMNAECIVDEVAQPATISDERFALVEYRAGREPVTVVADMLEADFQAAHSVQTSAFEMYGEYSIDALRVVERKARLCCPTSPKATLDIALGRDAQDEDDLAQGMDFLWILVE